MAFVSNDQTDDEDNKNTAQNPSQGPVSPSGGGSAVHLAPTSGVGSTGTSAGAPSANGTPAAGGSFATLDKYVGANQGQAEGLANTIASGAQSQADALNTQNQGVLTGIQGSINSAYTPQDTGVLSAEAADPVSFASNPSNISSFQNQINDQYTGPASAEGTAAFQTQQAAINNQISEDNAQTQTDAGRTQLLQGVEKAPTAGVTGLNNAILSQDPNAAASINNAYQNQFAGVLNGLNSGAAALDPSIAQAKTGAASASAAANKQIADQASGLQTALQGNVTKDQAAENDYNAAVNTSNTNLADFNPIASDINAYDTSYGITPFSGLSPYLASPTALYTDVPNINSAATNQNVALNSALSQLGGSNYSSPITDPTQAGTFAVPTLNSVSPVGDAAGLEYSALTPALQSTYNTLDGNLNPAALSTDPNGESYAIAGNAGDVHNPSPQAAAFEKLMQQLNGFNNGVISNQAGPGSGYLTVNDR